jgi:chromosome partitioning protein
MLILVGGQKGGGGKTTMATNIATMLIRDGRDVHLYDIDPQRTATLWASRRDEHQELILQRISSSQKVLDKRTINVGAVIRNELLAMRSRYEDMVIDAGGADNEALRAAMSLANIAIFPIIPSEFDMWTFDTLSNLVASSQGRDQKLVAKILLNKVNTNPLTAKKEIDDCDDFLSDFNNLERFNGFVSERVSIRRASGKGMGIIEYKPIDMRAVEEINTIYEEIMNERVRAEA